VCDVAQSERVGPAPDARDEVADDRARNEEPQRAGVPERSRETRRIEKIGFVEDRGLWSTVPEHAANRIRRVTRRSAMVVNQQGLQARPQPPRLLEALNRRRAHAFAQSGAHALGVRVRDKVLRGSSAGRVEAIGGRRHGGRGRGWAHRESHRSVTTRGGPAGRLPRARPRIAVR
jgi:hypothetical protein